MKTRAAISDAKAPMMAAVRKVLADRRDFWPLSDRQIHYALLNDPPLRHASKPASRYDNTVQSYRSLVELLTRARVAGLVPMEAIGDETRPLVRWVTSCDPGTFMARELDDFLKGYARDLMRGQPDHVELVGEKNTVLSVIKPVAAEYTLPLTIGRGYCSLPPRHGIAERYRRSGKGRLVLLMLSDFDPGGEEICHSFARSMRDDFGIADVLAVKVALTAEQVKAFRLPPVMTAKESSVHHGKFTKRHGHNVFELQALTPAQLQQALRQAIGGVLDREAFEAEVAAEKEDWRFLSGVRRVVADTLGGTDFGKGGSRP